MQVCLSLSGAVTAGRPPCPSGRWQLRSFTRGRMMSVEAPIAQAQAEDFFWAMSNQSPILLPMREEDEASLAQAHAFRFGQPESMRQERRRGGKGWVRRGNIQW